MNNGNQLPSLEHQPHPLALTLRGFAVDFLTAHNPAHAEKIMSPAYRLHIGGVTFNGRDEEYLPATVAQLDQFPGLTVTVHDVVIGENAIAMCFTEHGASIDDDSNVAAWSGITFFRTHEDRFIEGWAEEEYISRKRQLFLGECDLIEPPHPSPWDAKPGAPCPKNEVVVTEWLQTSKPLLDYPPNARLSALDPHPSGLLDIRSVKINTMFSAGDRVVFHAQYEGLYAGGFGDISPMAVGCPAILRLAGIVSVINDEVTEARITTDRLGLSRALRGLL